MSKFPSQKISLRRPSHLIAFGFGAGLLPYMPGTFGTLVAIPFYLLFSLFSWKLYLVVILISFFGGIWACHLAEEAVGVADYTGIVWDEMVGFWVTMFMVPVSGCYIVLGFLIFRMLDIFKPWPISFLNNHVHQGLGIMLDDLVAGIVSCVCLQVGRVFLHKWMLCF